MGGAVEINPNSANHTSGSNTSRPNSQSLIFEGLRKEGGEEKLGSVGIRRDFGRARGFMRGKWYWNFLRNETWNQNVNTDSSLLLCCQGIVVDVRIRRCIFGIYESS